eukprot:1357476-Amorphochlora_amoeboformis.AAC.1
MGPEYQPVLTGPPPSPAQAYEYYACPRSKWGTGSMYQLHINGGTLWYENWDEKYDFGRQWAHIPTDGPFLLHSCCVLLQQPGAITQFLDLSWIYISERWAAVRILFMVPVFAAESFFALLFLELAPVMRMLREFYEAFALFSFTQFVLTYLDGAENLAVQLAEDPEDIGHLFPFCLVRAWPRGGKFLRNTLMGILQ